MAVTISAVICTYNRAEMLRGALRSVVEQTLDAAAYEIVVVSNASTDHTDAVVREFQGSHSAHEIVLVHEARPGLGHARNRGYKAARGEYVAYLDDDAQAAPDWLEQALRCFGEVRPTPVVVGGPIVPYYEAPKPSWFRDEYEARTWGDTARWLGEGESLSGSNMVWQKTALEAVGGFAVEVGVSGEYLSVGEETVAFDNLWGTCAQPRVYYSPVMQVRHWTPASRMRPLYYLKRAFATGQASLMREGSAESVLRRLYRVARVSASIAFRLVSALTRLRGASHVANWVIEEGVPIASRVGVACSLLGLHIRFRQREVAPRSTAIPERPGSGAWT